MSPVYYKVGNYYGAYGFNSGAGVVLGTGKIGFLPFVVFPPGITISAIGVQLNTASAGGNLQLAVYNDVAGIPDGAALGSTASQSTTATSTYSLALGGNVPLVPGRYWLAINFDNAVAVAEGVVATTSAASGRIGSSVLGNALFSSGIVGKTTTQTFGTWPNATGLTYADSSQTSIPYLVVLVASVP